MDRQDLTSERHASGIYCHIENTYMYILYIYHIYISELDIKYKVSIDILMQHFGFLIFVSISESLFK